MRSDHALRIIRVFPRRTALTPRDDMAFVGDPPMLRPEANEVHVSCAFTWDRQIAWRLKEAWQQYYPIVRIGGPAFASPADGFQPGAYVARGVTFTSRGCKNQCPWCLVPTHEGALWELDGFAEGHIVQDNNLLQCSSGHINRVLDMLKTQRQIQFGGGLDARLLTDAIADQIRSLHVHQVFVACDTAGALTALIQSVKHLKMPQDRVRSYVLLAYGGETISQAIARLEDVWAAGAMPFAQLYQPPDKKIEYSREWRQLARQWSRPAIMKAMHDKGRN